MTDVSVSKGVVFGQGGGRDLKCDVFAPAELAGAAPALVLLHGGGWRNGSPEGMHPYAPSLAAAGFVCIASEYRLLGEAPWPAQIEDAKTAIRWTRAHSAELHVDPERIGVVGASAGGHLALLAAGTAGTGAFAGEGGYQDTSDAVAAVVAFFPVTLLEASEQLSSGARNAKGLLADAASAELAAAASPLTYLKPGFPPTLFLHGNGDTQVPVEASVVAYNALMAAGVPVEMHIYASQPHIFTRQPEFVDQACAESVHFLRRYLVGNRASEGEAAQQRMPAAV